MAHCGPNKNVIDFLGRQLRRITAAANVQAAWLSLRRESAHSKREHVYGGTRNWTREPENSILALGAMTFPDGSMGPKVRAACRFACATGKRAAIGALADLSRIVAGDAGTTVSPAESGIVYGG